MSAFIVSRKCMSNIISGLYHSKTIEGYRTGFLTEQCKTLNGKGFAILTARLYLMNQEAVRARYPDDKDVRYSEIPSLEKIKESLSWPMVSDTQFLKSLHCLKYQCSEGDVPKSSLYNWLCRVISAVESGMVRELPQYETAEWG